MKQLQVPSFLVAQMVKNLPAMQETWAPLSTGILQARILEWVATPFFRGSPHPRDQTQVSCIAGRFFTIWATRKEGTCSCFIYLPELLLRITPCPRLTIPGRILNMKSTDSWGRVFNNSLPINLLQSGAFLFSNSAICSSPFPTHFGLIP